MKKIKGLIGYSPSEMDMEEMDVVVEIRTDGTSSSGYEHEETIGIVRTQYGSLGIYRGCISESSPINTSTVLHMSDDGKSISDALRALADAYDDASNNENQLDQ